MRRATPRPAAAAASGTEGMTGARPRIAVLLAACNGMAWLPEQLESILGQQEVAVTVFISVDRSTDGTEDWLGERAASDARLVLLPGGRFGSAALNFYRLIGDVDFTAFDFVSLADQDDIWLPGKLRRAVDWLDRHGADGYSGNVIAFWPDGREMAVDKAQPQVAADFVFEAAGPGCTYVIRNRLAVALQVFLHAQATPGGGVFAHDWLIYAFARARGFRWMIDPQPHMRYRQHQSNQTGVNAGVRAFIKRAAMVGNGWAFEQAAIVARLVGAGTLPVSTWLGGGRTGLIRLSLHARQCRRRRRDQLLFFASCWLRALSPRPWRAARSGK